MKTAVIYTRVSTDEQAKHDLSLPFQREKCNEFAKANGYVVIKEFEDAGKSARTADRPALLEMISFISEHEVDGLIIHKSDRLSRDMADFWTIKKILNDKKVKLMSVSENFNDDNPADQFLMGIMSAQAQFYSANLGFEVKKGVSQKIKNGWWPTFAPIGYENYGEKHKRYIRPVHDIAKLVLYAFQLFASGDYSITSLTETLQKKGMLSTEGKPISRSAVSRMLRNPIYYGEFDWLGELHKGKHEPIITKQLFDTVQQLLDIRKVKGTRDRTHNFMLRGHVYCSCGSRLVGEQKVKKYLNGKQQEFFYFGCKSRKKTKNCSKNYVRMEVLEQLVSEEFKKIEFTEDFKKDVIKTAKSILAEVRETESEEEKIIKNRISKIKTRMKNAEDDRMDRIVSSDEFTDIYMRLKEELSIAMADLSNIQNDHTDKVKILDNILSLSENIYSSYIKADAILKRKYLRMFFEGIYVDNKEIVRVEYNPVVAQLTKIREVRITNNWRDVVNEVRTAVNIRKGFNTSFIHML